MQWLCWSHSALPPSTQQMQNKQPRTDGKPSGTPFDKRWALYFSHQKWNTTLSHSLKSTKANYPSFTQVPVGQQSPIYLAPDVSMSQSEDSRPQRGLLTSRWVLWFRDASESAGRSWCLLTGCRLMLTSWHHWLCKASAIQQGSIKWGEKKSIITSCRP